ncbi:uncharacterized protein AB675_7999 [Cyphellophora attinorum]|uniref:Uncharacterized protein n=1 Tax=Cyphellophora attinorum TaxID=1664694 RepID=A0A0N0NN31_9EURO|nr:uncharacterized protein AB675_7999 [Phialophora attinorum]KPI41048.1 hypothetical protein AB675_7999 [Phialophora attinorum]
MSYQDHENPPAVARPLPATPRLNPVELAPAHEPTSPSLTSSFIAINANQRRSDSLSTQSTDVPPRPPTPPPRPVAHLLAEWARDSTPFRGLQEAVMQGRAAESQIENYWNLVEEARRDEAERARKRHQREWEMSLQRADFSNVGDGSTPGRGRRSSMGPMDKWYQGYLRGESPVGQAAHITSLPWNVRDEMKVEYTDMAAVAQDDIATETSPTPGSRGAYQNDDSLDERTSTSEASGTEVDTEKASVFSERASDEMDWQSTDDETQTARRPNAGRIMRKKHRRDSKKDSKLRSKKLAQHISTTDDDPDGHVFESRRSDSDTDLPLENDEDEVMDSIESDQINTEGSNTDRGFGTSIPFS